MTAPLDMLGRDPLDRPCLAIISRPDRSIDSRELGGMLSPPERMATLGQVLDLAMAFLNWDGSVSIRFPSVGTF